MRHPLSKNRSSPGPAATRLVGLIFAGLGSLMYASTFVILFSHVSRLHGRPSEVRLSLLLAASGLTLFILGLELRKLTLRRSPSLPHHLISEPTSPEKIRCPLCELPTDQPSKFCDHCGEPL